MSSRPNRPNLQGAELGLFDVLLASHVRYMRQQYEYFELARSHGLSLERTQEIAAMVLVYAAPEQFAGRVKEIIGVVDQLLKHEARGTKPS